MKTVVKNIGKGKARIFNDQFLCMMSHFFIEPIACAPISDWEKSQLERQIKTLRKHLFQPMLSFQSLAELNVWLKDQCLKLMQTTKHLDETSLTVIQALERKRPALSA